MEEEREIIEELEDGEKYLKWSFGYDMASVFINS